MFCTKNLAILLSFLKEFTESKKRAEFNLQMQQNSD